jgi:hypothetical protein
MPLSKHSHKKKTGHWVKKWLTNILVGLKIQKRRIQKPPSDIVFLSTEEVKASLARIAEQESINISKDSSSRPDPGILPQKNRSRRKSRNEATFASRFNRFLSQISFGIFNKKHSRSSHHRRSRRKFPDHTTDAKFKKISELKSLKEDQAFTDPSNKGQRHHHHRKHIHRSLFRKWKSFLRRKLNLKEKKSDFSLPFTFENGDNILPVPEKKVPWTDYIKPVLTSTAMFMVAYQISWFFYQLAVMVTASFFRIDSVLFYYEVMFPEGSDSIKWSPEKIIIITLAGPFMALVVWIMLRLILKIKLRYGPHLRMFLVWLYLISMMMFFGAFVGGAITLEGFGYVIDWLFMSIALRMILSVVFISMIIALSWNVVRLMPETSRSASWKNSRYKYVLSRLIVPWVLGAGIMTLLKITKNITQHANIYDYDIINLATLVFAVVPPLFNSRSRPELNRMRKVNQRLRADQHVFWITGAIILVMFFRIVLSYGIYFNLVFNMDLYFYK